MQLLRKIAWPISQLYGMIVHLRNWCYDAGWLRSKSFGTPTICVGNLSLGGTGKTPMIEFLIRLLEVDKKIAVLSRGYKRKSKGFVLADGNATVATLGDEPFQLFSKFPDLQLAVDADRRRGITRLQKKVAPDLILLDDAFQHRKVRPSCNILLTTFDRPYPKDTFLPTGWLRDAKTQAKRAHVVVVTKCPAGIPLQERDRITRLLSLGVPVLFSYLDYASKLNSGEKSMDLNQLKGKTFALVTGIANPKPLVDHLKSSGLVFEHLNYPDHHDFSAGALEKFAKYPMVLTTEKDYVRLAGKLENLYSIGVQHRFIAEGATILGNVIENCTKRHSQSWD